MRDADVLILGGGCAGLSLAVALAAEAPHLRVITLEERRGYQRDRTWCFWSGTPHPFLSGVTHSWNTWRVRDGAREAVQRSQRFAYQHLPADHFYAIAQQRIAAAGQELQLGTVATATRDVDEGCEVTTNRGALRARWVFDGRTPAPGVLRPRLWQRFHGWHVRTAQPCFEPAVVDLMDFQATDRLGRSAFFYTLPFSPHEALVEITFLDAAELAPADGVLWLEARMQQLCPRGDYDVLYRESGALPMGTHCAASAAKGSLVPIGTRGGRVKPSSGYAFQRIQAQSHAFARALASGQPLPMQVEAPVYSMLDRVFLQALTHRPRRTPAYFLQLFQHVPADLLVPFLSETATSRALLATMLALPKRDFLQAALQCALEPA